MHHPPATTAEWEHARALLQRYGWNTMACQILAPEIRYWFSAEQDAVIGYVPVGHTWVVAGAPTCAFERLTPVAHAFATSAAQQRRRVCYIGAQDRLLTGVFGRMPQAHLLLGAQPIWNPQHWPAILARKASLRAQLARARNKGIAVDVLGADLYQQGDALHKCLEEWRTRRGLPPLQFLVAPDIFGRPSNRRILLARQQHVVVAYVVLVPIAARKGWLIEQIVRSHAAPNGVAELLIDAAMQQIASEGAAYSTMGLAPLALQRVPAAIQPPVLLRSIMQWMQAAGQRFYNFGGLEAFKAKFQPDAWEPIYALSAERRLSLRTLHTIAGAFCGMAPELFFVQILSRMRHPPSG